jgi:sugar phosphate isomerase/epimerase
VSEADGNAKIGIGTWSYTMEGAPPFEQVARQLAGEGYDGIELDGGREFFHVETLVSSGDRRRLVRELRQIGLEPSGYNPSLYEFDVTSADQGDRRAYLAAVQAALELCVECGIETMRLDTGQPPPGPPELDQDTRVKRVIDLWSQATQLAAKAGVALAWEFEPGFMCNRPSEVVAIVNGIDDPHFGVLFDSCHAHMVATVGARQEQPPEKLENGELELAQALRGRINLVHLIDSDETIHDEFTSTHAPFGRGVIDFPPLIAALREGGYARPWWNVDLCFWPDPASWTEESRQTIRRLLTKA